MKESYRGTVAGLADAELQRIKIIDQDNSVIVVYKPGRTRRSEKERKSEKEHKSQRERKSEKKRKSEK
jgi:hypothetical protein